MPSNGKVTGFSHCAPPQEETSNTVIEYFVGSLSNDNMVALAVGSIAGYFPGTKPLWQLVVGKVSPCSLSVPKHMSRSHRQA